MPTHEERATQHTALLTTLGQLEALQPEQLRRLDLPADVNFDGGTPYFEETWRLFRDLAQMPLDRATFSVLSRLNGVAQQNLGILQQIKAFNPTTYGANARPQRDALLQQVRDVYDGAFDTVMPARAMLTNTITDSAQVAADAQRVLARIDALFSDKQEELNAKVAQATEALDAVRQLAAEAGVSQHALYFREEANEHRKAATRWLLATAALALVTLGFGAWSYAYHLQAAPILPAGALVQLTIAKLIVFSVLVTALVWTGQVYRAHRHNYVVNKHRQNALSTFQAFAQAALDAQTKNVVLVQAMQSVFAPQETGFTGRPSEGTSSPQVLEFFRGVTPEK
jgi:DNA-binding phage protein